MTEEEYFKLLEPDTPFVYFNSAREYLLKQVSPYFNQYFPDLTNEKDEPIHDKITAAFTFLDSAIASERMKEEAFLNFLKQSIKNGEIELNIKIPDINSDWQSFVKEIQANVSIGNLGIKTIENEIKRLEQNMFNKKNNIVRPGRENQILAAKESLTQTQNFLTNLINTINNNDKKINIILETVLERYGKQLLKHENRKLVFDKSQLLAMVLEISHIISDAYTISEYNAMQYPQLTKENLNKALDKADVDEQINSLITRAQECPWVSENIIRNYRLGNLSTSGEQISVNSFLDATNNITSNTKILYNNFLSLYKNYRFPSSAIQLVQKHDLFGEIQSLIKFEITGALGSYNTGKTGAKPDNVIGYITIDPNDPKIQQSENKKEIIKTISKINDKIKKLADEMKSKNTADYYKGQFDRWNKTKEEINKLLLELKEKYEILSNCFIIEDSSKNYKTLYLDNKEFHGGSAGADIGDQLQKLYNLAETGQFDLIDIKWLQTVAINTGSDMIARNKKQQLQNYLSIFIGILLFDSQLNIVQDALIINTQKQLTAGSTYTINLFSLDEGYYPLSYVLKLTKDKLNKNLSDVESQPNGVKAEIQGYVSEPNKTASKFFSTWKETGEAALDQTKIKINFLAGFLNTLHQLYPSI